MLVLRNKFFMTNKGQKRPCMTKKMMGTVKPDEATGLVFEVSKIKTNP